MAYRLLIEMDIQFTSLFRRFLKPGDVIRGEPARLTFFVTNLGRNTFPGGRVRNWRVLFGPETDIEHTSATANVQCKPIPPRNKVKLLSEEIVPLTEGLAWVNFSIKHIGEEKEKVQYYQSPKELVSGEEWTQCFYVVDLQMVQLTSAIDELIKNLEALKG